VRSGSSTGARHQLHQAAMPAVGKTHQVHSRAEDSSGRWRRGCGRPRSVRVAGFRCDGASRSAAGPARNRSILVGAVGDEADAIARAMEDMGVAGSDSREGRNGDYRRVRGKGRVLCAQEGESGTVGVGLIAATVPLQAARMRLQ
jgi:hypothetical protein